MSFVRTMSNAQLLEELKSLKKEERLFAIKKIGMQYDPAAVRYVLPLLDDEDEEIREATILTLGVIGSEDIIPKIVEALSDPSNRVKLAAIKVLGEFRTTKATRPLIRLLSSKNDEIKEAVIIALGQIQDRNAIFPLIDSLEEEDPNLRITAINALGQIGDNRAVEPLLELLQKEKEPEVIQAIAIALARIGDEEAIPALLELLNDKNAQTRQYAIIALGKFKDPRTIEPLLKALDDSDPYVRRVAATTLSEIKDSKTIFHFIQKLHDSSPEIRATAAKALGKLGDVSAAKNLQVLLSDPSADVREEAVLALGELRVIESERYIVKLAKDKNKSVRLAVAKALGKIESSRVYSKDLSSKFEKIKSMLVIRALIKLLKDPEVEVRPFAAEALAKIYLRQKDFKKAANYYGIASKESLSWDFHQLFFNACKNGALLLLKVSHGEINIDKEVFNGIKQDLTASAKMIGTSTFISQFYWDAVESFLVILRSNEKDDFIKAFKDYGMKLVILQKNLPDEYKSLVEPVQTKLNEKYQIINKRGLKLEDSLDELEMLKEELIKLGIDILIIEPIESGNEETDLDKKIINNLALTQAPLTIIEGPSNKTLRISPATLERFRIEDTFDMDSKEHPKFIIHNVTLKIPSPEEDVLFSLIQIMKGAKIRSILEDKFDIWIRNVERYYVVKKEEDLSPRKQKQFSFMEDQVYIFTKTAIDFRIKPKVIGFLDDVIYEGASFVIFPETSIPYDYYDKLKQFAERAHIFIVAGFEHKWEEGKFHNRIYLFTPDSREFFIEKNTPTVLPSEKRLGFSWKENIAERSPPEFTLFSTPMGNFMVLFLEDLNTYQEFFPFIVSENEIDFLIVLNNGFEGISELKAMKPLIEELGIPLLYANSGQFGGTGVYYPSKLNDHFADVIDSGYYEGITLWTYRKGEQQQANDSSSIAKEPSKGVAADALQALVDKIIKEKTQ